VLPLIRANLKMMVRNRQAVFWALFFPLLLVVVFGMFDFRGVSSTDLVIIDLSEGPRAELLRERLENIEFLDVEGGGPDSINRKEAVDDLVDGDLGYLIVIPRGFDDPAGEASASGPEPVELVYTTRNPDRNQLVDGAVRSLVSDIRSGGQPIVPAQMVSSDVIDAPEVDYFDTVLLGLLALGIMTNSIISIAVRMSTYRNQSILKRLLVTPLPIWKFFAGEITAHVLLALVQAGIILAVGVFVFGGRIEGNVGWLLIITVLGSIVFLNIGFILSAWARSPAAASGMGNAVALPMMFFAGTFFSTASLPWVVPYIAQALPLTPMLEALREVGIDNAPLWETWPHLAVLGGWVVATAIAATRVFRFS
jgi:ABC-2 type transport system permease protein